MHNECWGIILAAGQGRRMAEAEKGIYIVDGEKVLVK
jgi:molybdopterin-guanine dinucleotide biosynthesis protein A